MNNSFHARTIKYIYKPKPRLELSEWCDRYRTMTTTSSRPGKWKTSFTPYLREIMDNLSPFSNVKEIYVIKAAQLGLTEIGINWMLYIIDQEQARTWYVLPTDQNIRTTSKTRVEPALKLHPNIRAKIIENASAKDNDQIRMKIFSGGSLQFVSARVAKNLKSEAVKNIFIDELDEAPFDVEGQGSPIELLQHRQSTFFDSKLFAVSTPTAKGRSLIEKNYLSCEDKRVYMLPCPVCQGLHRWHKDNFDMKKLLMQCPHCKHEYDESHKTNMMNNGKWVSIDRDLHTKKPITIGYSINSFYSPIGFVSWAKIAKKWFSSYKDTEKIKTFFNQFMGETWEVKASRVSEYKLLNRVENYDPYTDLPHGVLGVTAGVDIQADRVELEVVGWGYNKESWSLAYEVFYGDTGHFNNPVFKTLYKFLAISCVFRKKDYKNQNCIHRIQATAIDCNYRTHVIHDVVRAINRAWGGCYGFHGHSFARSVGNASIRKAKGGERIYNVDVDEFKEELFDQLNLEQHGDGYCHFTQHNDKDYFQMLTGEQKVLADNIRGYKFEKIRTRNEALDCRVYAMAVAKHTGMAQDLAIVYENE